METVPTDNVFVLVLVIGRQNFNIWNENELNKLNGEERRIASALFKTIVSVLGTSVHKTLGLMDNYFYVGGNSLNAVIVVTKLRDQGFHLGTNHIFLQRSKAWPAKSFRI